MASEEGEVEAQAEDEVHQVAEVEAEVEVALAGTNRIVPNMVYDGLQDRMLIFSSLSFELSEVVVVGTEAVVEEEVVVMVAEDAAVEMVAEDAAVETVVEDEVA